jgi:hypothetical protein
MTGQLGGGWLGEAGLGELAPAANTAPAQHLDEAQETAVYTVRPEKKARKKHTYVVLSVLAVSVFGA